MIKRETSLAVVLTASSFETKTRISPGWGVVTMIGLGKDVASAVGVASVAILAAKAAEFIFLASAVCVAETSIGSVFC